MASRRDELNAYSFARKRTNAAFLKPLPNGSIESAPKPMKAVVPSIMMGLLILVGFGACGIIKPVAPPGWDEVRTNVLVGSDSTTRYVVLKNKDTGEKLLHPILNLASAKLLIDPTKFKVVQVKEDELDKGKLLHGAAVGIPYAPDRLPSPDDVDKPKVWAVCNRPGSGTNSKPQQAVFVLGDKDKNKVEGSGKLVVRQALYVEDPNHVKWLVDQNGFAFQLDATLATLGGQNKIPGLSEEDANRNLRRVLFGEAEPQQVTQEWMDTLVKSPLPIYMPTIEGAGTPRSDGAVPAKYNKVGMVVEDGSSGQKYVVTQEGVEKVSNFVAKLLLQGPNGQKLTGGESLTPPKLNSSTIHPMDDPQDPDKAAQYLGKIPGHEDVDMPWPTEVVDAANNFKTGSQTGGLTTPTPNGVSCSVYKGTNTKYPSEAAKALGFPNGVPNMQTWVGKDYPAKIAAGSTAYVTPGSGLLFQRVSTGAQKSGSLFLVTDTGLRYSVPRGNDSSTSTGKGDQEVDQAQIHLGYKDAHPPLILKTWVDLLSAGPALTVSDAEKPQGS